MPDSVTIPDLGESLTVSNLAETVTIPTYVYTATAGAGSYVLTGQDAELRFGYGVPADQGSYTLTGQDMTPVRALIVAADQGSYAATGQDAELRFGYSFVPEHGSFALTGQDLAFLRDVVIVAEQGGYVLTGQTADLKRHLVVEMGQGSLTLTGQDADLTIPVAAITGMRLFGSSVTGYSNYTGRTITPVLKASNSNPTGTGWTGTTIGSIAGFANVYAATEKSTLGNANTTRYRYVWAEISISPADQGFLGEMEFYETIPGGSETLIDDTGLTIITDNFTNTANAVDDNTSTHASAPSASVNRIGLDLGAL
jgi:hypothetical protein